MRKRPSLICMLFLLAFSLTLALTLSPPPPPPPPPSPSPPPPSQVDIEKLIRQQKNMSQLLSASGNIMSNGSLTQVLLAPSH